MSSSEGRTAGGAVFGTGDNSNRRQTYFKDRVAQAEEPRCEPKVLLAEWEARTGHHAQVCKCKVDTRDVDETVADPQRREQTPTQPAVQAARGYRGLSGLQEGVGEHAPSSVCAWAPARGPGDRGVHAKAGSI
jgi:hypothetical protein